MSSIDSNDGNISLIKLTYVLEIQIKSGENIRYINDNTDDSNHIEEEDRLISQMMLDLKKQKQQQKQKLQQQIDNEHNDHTVYQDSSGYVSLNIKAANQFATQESPTRNKYKQYQASTLQEITETSIISEHLKPNQKFDYQREVSFKKESTFNIGQYEDYEEIKKRKIDDLKNQVLNEKQNMFSTVQVNNSSHIKESKTPTKDQNKIHQIPSQFEQSNNDKRSSITPSNKTISFISQNQNMTTSFANKSPINAHKSNQNQARAFPKYSPILDKNKPQQSSINQQQIDTKSSNSTRNMFNTVQQIHKTQQPPIRQSDRSQTRLNNQTQTFDQSRQQQLSNNRLSNQDHHQQQQQYDRSNLLYNNSNTQASTQLSEKTQQIYFKKLQKEVETSIREADKLDKGGLDLEEFKQCFFNLNYLPYINPKFNQDAKGHDKINDYTYQNTTRNLMIQEKEFIYNLWAILNPQNNSFIDNAMLYDVLLLLIYNVKSTIPTTAGFLTEYLENHYLEEQVDINIFENYNSGSSLGIKSTEDHQNESQNLSNLNKYLAYNNMWQVEKIAIEFKQIHANKIAYTQSLRQRSTSPIISLKVGQNNNEVISQNDRKFKPNIINEHIQELTFTPNLSNQTKKLDQKLTQRLLEENQRSGILKRDVSADHISRNPSQNTLIKSLNHQQVNESDNYQSSANLNRYELLFYRHHLAEQKIEKAKENLINKELEECSFKPNILKQSQATGGGSYINMKREANQIFKDLSQKIKNQKQKLEETAKKDKELVECTFKPNILGQTKKTSSKQPDKIPKGYYEQINRMRKTAEEKRVFEEKQKKKEVGDNYEKLKSLPIKPPSFIDSKREKKKLLMYVDVNITPTKAGRIGIYEGDNIKDLARNFQKTFQLNNGMLHMLMHQLEQHLINYKDKHGIVDDNRTTFPKGIEVSSTKSQNTGSRQNTEEQQEDEESSTFENRKNKKRNKDKGTPGSNAPQINPFNLDSSDKRVDGYDIKNKLNKDLYDEEYEDLNDNIDDNEELIGDMDGDPDSHRLNEYVRQEIMKFDQLERERIEREIGFITSQNHRSNNNLNNYDDSFNNRNVQSLQNY